MRIYLHRNKMKCMQREILKTEMEAALAKLNRNKTAEPDGIVI